MRRSRTRGASKPDAMGRNIIRKTCPQSGGRSGTLVAGFLECGARKFENRCPRKNPIREIREKVRDLF
ncbi:hypothetical protein JCM3263A_03340 [Thermobifida fusca]|jgi:hypothetical protein